MDHDDVIEQLELAAVEPDGLARLMAGDTAIAAAVAGHLAGCEGCSGEFQRLSRAAPLLRDVVRTTPPADLRERTLAFVREHGVPRGEAARATATAREAAAIASVGPGAPGEAALPAGAAGTAESAPAPLTAAGGPRRFRALPWVAGLTAAVVLAAVATSYLADRQSSQGLAEYERAIAGLEAVERATLEITAEPDAERVTLAATGTQTSGSLLFSPRTTKLVVVATGLERPPAGKEYRCWVELAGKRENVGRMFFADDLAFWVGDTPAIGDVEPGTLFGVSLAELDGSLVDGPPVISGEL
jgi:hypothetical protein